MFDVVVVTVIIYKLILIGIGVWAAGRNSNDEDYYLASRGLGSWVAALSASASSSSAWTLLGVSGAAYAWGLSAIWLFPATLLGFCINWFLVAPAVQKRMVTTDAITMNAFLLGRSNTPVSLFNRRMAALILVFSFTVYVAAQFQGAAQAFSSILDTSFTQSLVIGAVIVTLYTLMGGFWAVSLTDTLQGLMMALVSVLLPVYALVALGGPHELWQLLQAAEGEQGTWYGQWQGPAAIGFVMGLLGIGLAYPGQPHIITRFMALRNEKELVKGRRIAISWAVLIYSGMLIVGWAARAILDTHGQDAVLIEMARSLMPGVLMGITIAAILSAIMSTADSQLLVAASAVTEDFPREPARGRKSLFLSRLTVLILGFFAALCALYIPETIFARVLFAWSAIGAAFGPLLVFRLLDIDVSEAGQGVAMFLGFFATVILYSMPSGPGDVYERLIPLALAGLTAWLARVKD